jgi:hypothetical protein
MSEIERMEKQFQAELKMIQTLYQETAKNASKALEDVQKTNKETSKNARAVLDDVKMTNKELMSLFKKIATIVISSATIIGAILGFFGFEKYKDIKKTFQKIEDSAVKAQNFAEQSRRSAEDSKSTFNESKRYSAEAEEQMNKMREMVTQAESLRQIMLEIRRIAVGCRINEKVNTDNEEQLLNLYIKHQFVERDLFSHYISDYSKYDYEVVFEAVATYIKIAENAEIALNPNEISTMKNAIMYVLKQVGQLKPTNWRIQLECRNFYLNLCDPKKHKGIEPREKIENDLSIEIMISGENDVLGWNTAMIMSELGIRHDRALDILRETVESNMSQWRVCLSCIALIKLGENDGWKLISKQFEGKTNSAFIASLLLGRLGKNELTKLGIEDLTVGYQADKVSVIVNILKRYLHNPPHKYYRIYLSHVIKKLET